MLPNKRNVSLTFRRLSDEARVVATQVSTQRLYSRDVSAVGLTIMLNRAVTCCIMAGELGSAIKQEQKIVAKRAPNVNIRGRGAESTYGLPCFESDSD
jgi:hypothetical protein